MALARDFASRRPDEAFLYESIAALNPPDTIAVYGRGLVETRLDPAAVAGLRVPTRLVVGREDAFFSVEAMEEVARVIPGARLEILEGAGHSPYFETPGPFHERVDAFLREVGWGSSS
jgi:pimeloyl-ACP methyl ester carboxylesterase